MRLVLVGFDKPLEERSGAIFLDAGEREVFYVKPRHECDCLFIYKVKTDPTVDYVTEYIYLCDWHTADILSATPAVRTNGCFVHLLIDVKKSARAERAARELGVAGRIVRLVGLEDVMSWETIKRVMDFLMKKRELLFSR